ncbi:MAG TPA: hypothetical protein PLS94_09340 [Prolixibacteraceae bacterium]|nr:hypothetical protein [Prolixibacteraceae bacterium]
MDKTRKFTSIILWVLMALSVGLFIYMVANIDDESNPGKIAVQAITLNLNWAIGLFAIATVVAIVFALFQMFGEKSKAIRALIVLAIFAVVLGVSYSVSSSEIPSFFGVEKFLADGTLTANISRWVDTGLYVTYILFAGAFLSIIGFTAANALKRS